MKITYLGTTSLLFDDGTDQVLFDAHFTRPSMLQAMTGKFSTNQKLTDQLIHEHRIHHLRAIFVSHSHYDHVMDAPYLAQRTGAEIYGSDSTIQVGLGGGIPMAKMTRFRGGESYVLGDFKITVLTSVHSKAHWYNNDLGQNITEPLVQPATKKDYKEGGSYDFLVEHRGKTFLIRPSFNCIPGQLDSVRADILFLGIAGLSKASGKTERRFFHETVEKVQPKLVIPLHWDNFFTPLMKPVKGMPTLIENTRRSHFRLVRYCREHRISCIVQMPHSFIEV